MEKTSLLQQILVYVVSIICSFIDLNSNVCQNAQLYNKTIGYVSGDVASPVGSSSSLKAPYCETSFHWHQKAVVSVMEAGGLNWLVGKVGNFELTSSAPWLGMLTDETCRKHLWYYKTCIDIVQVVHQPLPQHGFSYVCVPSENNLGSFSLVSNGSHFCGVSNRFCMLTIAWMNAKMLNLYALGKYYSFD